MPHRKAPEARQTEQFLAQSQLVASQPHGDQSDHETTDVNLESLSRASGQSNRPAQHAQFEWLDVGIFSLVAVLFWFPCLLFFTEDKVQVWTVAGDTVRNLSGIIVVAGAWIAWETNKSRANEAEKSDFRDRMR